MFLLGCAFVGGSKVVLFLCACFFLGVGGGGAGGVEERQKGLVFKIN